MRIQDYSIGELSAETGVKVPTIRYYEGIGLIAAPARTGGNHRRYDESARERLQFVSHARAMGFPMDSLKSMLRIAGHKDAPCADLDALVRGRLAEVEDRIAKLAALRAELSSMLASHQHGTVGECRVVEVLSDHANCACDH
jgi:DNA-binding transcriptional MerR regulator